MATAPNSVDVVIGQTVRDRVRAFLDALLEHTKFNPAFRPVIVNLLTGYLKQTSDEELTRGLIAVRDEIIPFLLTGDKPGPEGPHDADTHSQ